MHAYVLVVVAHMCNNPTASKGTSVEVLYVYIWYRSHLLVGSFILGGHKLPCHHRRFDEQQLERCVSS
jgi:hypothetical protein